MKYSLTQDLQDRLTACAKRGDENCHDDPPPEWPELMREAVAKLRDVEERLEKMWQDYRWSGD